MGTKAKSTLWTVILALLLVVAIAAPALASVAFSGIVTLQVSTNTTYSYYPAYINMDNSFLAAHYFTSASLLDVDVKDTGNTSLAMMPTTDKTWFIPTSLAANSITSFIWSSSNTPKASHQIIVGNGGYVTTVDNAKWEPHDSFALTLSAPLFTTHTIFDKLNALRADYTASNQTLVLKAGPYSSPDITLTATGVTAGTHVIKVATTATGIGVDITLRPNGPGDLTTIPDLFGAATHWQAVSDQNDSTGVSSDVGLTWYSDLYTIPTTSVTDFASVNLTARPFATSNGNSLKFLLKMPGFSVWNSDIEVINSGATGDLTISLATNPITSAPWNPADLTSLQIGVAIANQAVLGQIACDELRMTLVSPSYLPVLNLYVDNMAVPVDSEIMAAPIPDNANNWLWYPNPYFNYVKLEAAN